MPTRVTGLPNIFAGATVGVEAGSPPNITQHRIAPTTTDYYNFNTGDLWLQSVPTNTTPVAGTLRAWMLAAKNVNGQNQKTATWIPFFNGGAGALVSLTGNTGGAVFGDVNQNINTVGDNIGIVATGVPGTNTITFSLKNGGSAVIGLQPDFGAVVSPIAGIINIHNPPIAIDGNILTQNGTINGDPANYLDLRLADSISITNNGFFGLRNNAGGGVAVYNPTNTVDQYNLSINTFNSSANSSGMNIVHARGTPTAPTDTISGDTLGTIGFAGRGTTVTTNFTYGATIRSVTSGTIGLNRIPANLIFATHPNTATSTTPIDRMIISSAGNTTVNVADSGFTLASHGLTQIYDDTASLVNPPTLQFLKTNLSGPVTSAANLGFIYFSGLDTTSAGVSGALISSGSVAGSTGPGQLDGQLSFWTKGTGAGVLTARVGISNAGNVVVNSPDSGVTLNLQSTYNTAVGATQALMVIDNTGNVGTAGTFSITTGSITPTLTFSTSTGTITYVSQAGRYTQIGNIVNFIVSVAVSSIGTSSGNMSIAGFPVAVTTIANLPQDCSAEISGTNITLSAGATLVWGTATPTTTSIAISQGGPGVVASAFGSGNIAAGTFTITLQGFYFTS